jgi:hypothetical protein
MTGQSARIQVHKWSMPEGGDSWMVEDIDLRHASGPSVKNSIFDVSPANLPSPSQSRARAIRFTNQGRFRSNSSAGCGLDA